MPQLTVEHKKIPKTITTNQVVENKSEELQQENKREGHGLNISLTRNVFYMPDAKDVYYVQSEHSDNIYYYVKYNPDVIEYCSCPDNSIRLEKCKHIWCIEKSIVKGTLKEINKLPLNVRQFANQSQSKSWKDDDYSF